VTEPIGDLHLVLDRSAIAAFLDGSVAVGEAISLLLEESHAQFGIHLYPLAEVYRPARDGSPSLLPFLVGHIAFRTLNLSQHDLDHLLTLTNRFESAEMAAAMVSAEEHDALVLTAHPDRYIHADGSPHERVVGI
jgi:hypothetical protein